MTLKNLLSEEQIIDSEKRLLEAIQSGDVRALDDLLHDDLLFMIPNGQIITKAMDLEAYRTGSMMINEITSHLDRLNLMGEVAVVTLTIDTKGVMLGQPNEGTFRYIRVWKQSGDSCRVIAGSCIRV